MASTTAVESLGHRQAQLLGAETVDRPTSGRLVVGFSVVLAGCGLFVLWQIRNEGHLTPETGIGYALGIAGVAAMLLLLTYPLRKRVRFMRNWGPVEVWFRLHMILGLVAPALILIHCNFRFGSLNSTVALVSMLVVAGSGIVGRVIYMRIHFGLYGARTSLEELRGLVDRNARAASAVLAVCPAAKDRLIRFADASLAPASGMFRAGLRILLIGPLVRWHRIWALRALAHALSDAAARGGWPRARRREEARAARHFVGGFLATVRKTIQFSFYERLFALWHVFHIPLFFLLILATAVHIAAVHMY